MHTHTLDARDKEVKNLMGKAKENAKQTRDTTRNLYAASISGTAESLVLPKVLTTTHENFLLYDSRQDIHQKDPNNCIIMFATQSALDFLATCDTIFMDGTFSSAPALFEQMYTIHGGYKQCL